MTETLERHLKELSPDFLEELYGSPYLTGMCWGLECADGWYEPLKKFAVNIQKLNDTLSDAMFVAVQIKQKYGNLCVFWELKKREGEPLTRDTVNLETELNKYKPALDKFYAYLKEVEHETSVTCEHCGKVQDPLKATTGWVQYICDDCFKKFKKENIYESSSGCSGESVSNKDRAAARNSWKRLQHHA